MQCKDIPEEPILRRLAEFRPTAGFWSRQPDPLSFTLFNVVLEGDDPNEFMPTLVPAFPPGCDWKLMNAKMNGLLRRGLVDGCPCGCRGDWHITPKGREHLAKGATT